MILAKPLLFILALSAAIWELIPMVVNLAYNLIYG